MCEFFIQHKKCVKENYFFLPSSFPLGHNLGRKDVEELVTAQKHAFL